jgi:hypothetical protein
MIELSPIKDTGGSAFPAPATNATFASSGMTLRDYFAAKAMQGLLASGIECGPDDVASVVASAYILADAMLKARTK